MMLLVSLTFGGPAAFFVDLRRHIAGCASSLMGLRRFGVSCRLFVGVTDGLRPRLLSLSLGESIKISRLAAKTTACGTVCNLAETFSLPTHKMGSSRLA